MTPSRRMFRSPVFWLTLIIIAQASFTLLFALTLRYELKTSSFDGVLFAQILHNIIAGHGFISTIAPPHIPQHFFGVHFSPILYVLVPIYYLFPFVETLVVVHCFAIALAALPLFYIARFLLASEKQALAIALLYLLNPFIINAQLWDFHEVALAPLCFGLLLWSVATKRHWLFITSCLLLWLIKEHYGLAIFGAGLLWGWRWRQWRFGGTIAILGLIGLALVIGVIMPHFSPLSAPAMMAEDSSIDRFSWLAHPFSITSPLSRIFHEDIKYVTILLLPVWFLPLASPVWLFPGAADVVTNLLSASGLMRSIYSYHTAPLIILIYVAYATALKRYFVIPIRWMLFAGSLAFNLWFIVIAPTLPFGNNNRELSSIKLTLSAENQIALAHIKTIIPPDASVSAQCNILPHIPLRYEMYHFSEGADHASYIVLHTGFPYQYHYSVMGSPYSVEGKEYFAKAKALLTDPHWGIVSYENSWLVLKRSAPSVPGLQRQVFLDIEKTQKLRETIKQSLKLEP